ncbi:hypothetical protein DDZ18_09455 [Marinicauda salina]|uniref:Uncharacterized protein n=2 Tax=Marinicauda salina TaxID=2135793 RepID=A0A2U2BSF6_9PROT|nr:hypothetical protein DDZ18_09455 [Marinicauda salina]
MMAGGFAVAQEIAAEPEPEQVVERPIQRVDVAPMTEYEARTRERLAYDERIVERIEAWRAEREQEAAQARRAAAERDAHGRRLAPVDWDAAHSAWRDQLERDQESWNEDAQPSNPGNPGVAAMAPQGMRTPPPVRTVNIEPEELQRPRLPVLTPRVAHARTAGVRHAQAGDGMLMFPRDHVYSASMHVDELAIEVTGSRVAMREMTADEPMRRRLAAARQDDGVRITQNRAGVELVFNRFGATYSIQIMCEDPENTPACRDPETARAVYRRLALSGGSPQGMENR